MGTGTGEGSQKNTDQTQRGLKEVYEGKEEAKCAWKIKPIEAHRPVKGEGLSESTPRINRV